MKFGLLSYNLGHAKGLGRSLNFWVVPIIGITVAVFCHHFSVKIKALDITTYGLLGYFEETDLKNMVFRPCPIFVIFKTKLI
jgi:hypothetical protein